MNYYCEDKVFCPYCKAKWVNPHLYSRVPQQDMPVENEIAICHSCNKKYKIEVKTVIFYNLYCNCKLNDEEHEWEWVNRGLNRYVCKKCSEKGSKKKLKGKNE